MIQFTTTFVALVATLFSGSVIAHPGHDINAEIQERAEARASLKYRSLAHCADAIKARDSFLIERRKASLQHLRKKRSIKKRGVEDVLNTDHRSNETYTPDTPDDVIFGSNSSCILQPETTEGPYYVSGEYVRQDITDDEPGVPLTYDVQIIDVNTCEPIPNVALESWHCNSTGVYGGVVAGGNGNTADASNINNTALRGIQVSNEYGVVTVDTIFPGHYTGRTGHIHVLAHINATVNTKNNTLTGGHISHVGQLFFDQSLITEVELEAPYNTNTQQLTTNQGDGIFAQEAQTSDPVLTYVLLGDTVAEGIFGWITVGIDPNIQKNVSAAAYLDENGGHANPGGGGGPGGPGGPPPGFPTGAPPTGAPPTALPTTTAA